MKHTVKKETDKDIRPAKHLSLFPLFIFLLCCTVSCSKNTDPRSMSDSLTGLSGESITESAGLSPDTTDAVPFPDSSDSEKTEEDTKEGTAESVEENAPESLSPLLPETDTVSGRADWELAYIKYLSTLESGGSCTYSLIYVDEDDIPELVIDTGYEAGGCMLLTWHENSLDTLQTSRLYFNYIEKGNLLCNSEGHMGYYYDDIYTIQNGKWTYLSGGTYGDPPQGPALDENGIPVYIYNWNGTDVSEDEYQANLNAVYPYSPGSPAIEPTKYYILDEILSVLKTDDVTCAGHRYELVIEDLTWTEANAACKAKGGYLATITSFEEWERITDQISSEEKTSVTFWVGAKDTCWLEPGIEGGYPMLALHNALFRFWLEGEPSYRGLREDGVEVKEEYVVLLYRRSDKQYYLNDVPDDILSAAPSYAGKVGYICEYDT